MVVFAGGCLQRAWFVISQNEFRHRQHRPIVGMCPLSTGEMMLATRTNYQELGVSKNLAAHIR